uniref:Uncharacterized protein n=1 Tax=Anopheles atroparvus TaxID=41427 RepID=A0A182IZW2_ANOAO
MVAGRLLPPAILFVSGTTTCATELLLLLLLTVGCETIARGASSARIVAAVVDAGAAGDATGGGVGGAGFAIVPAAPMNAPAYFRSPHIGSKCFSFQGDDDDEAAATPPPPEVTVIVVLAGSTIVPVDVVMIVLLLPPVAFVLVLLVVVVYVIACIFASERELGSIFTAATAAVVEDVAAGCTGLIVDCMW